MSSIAIDHLGRDELIILLNRVAARLAILPDNPAPAGTQQTPIFYGYRSHATPNYISRSPVATNNYWRPWYEEEHDPWNAHLRSEHSAASAGATIYTRQLDAQSPSSHSFCRGAPGDLPTTTRLTDAMTYRYSLVDIQHSVHMRPKRIPTQEAQWRGLRLKVTFVFAPALATTVAAYAAYGREGTLCIVAYCIKSLELDG